MRRGPMHALMRKHALQEELRAAPTLSGVRLAFGRRRKPGPLNGHKRADVRHAPKIGWVRNLLCKVGRTKRGRST